MSDTSLRKRPTASNATVAEPTKTKSKSEHIKDEGETGTGLRVTDILQVLLGLFILSSAFSWFITGESILWGLKPWFTQPSQIKSWLVSFGRHTTP
jgi:hypothetical protein